MAAVAAAHCVLSATSNKVLQSGGTQHNTTILTYAQKKKSSDVNSGELL